MSRSKWKNPNTKQLIGANKKNKMLIIERNYELTPNSIGKMYKVHNGKTFIKLSVTEEMIGYKVGEFIPTRSKFVFKKKKKKKK